MTMKICAIRIFRHDLPVKGLPYTFSGGAVTALDTTLVEIVTDTGVSGFGETCPLTSTYQPAHAAGARAALCEMAPHLVGLDPLLIGLARDRMDAVLQGHDYTKAALDIALWDLAGKALGRRVCDLLGGAKREKVPSYYAVGIETPDETARIAQDKQAQGFTRLQFKVGGRSIEEDIAVAHRVFEVREPAVRIALDANRSWTTSDTIHLSQSCQDLTFVMEQPCATYDEVKGIKPQLCHPIYLDENTVDLAIIMRSIHENVADGFGMKMTRVGGLSPMQTIRDVCQATRRPMSVDDSWGGDIIAAACLHMAATLQPDLSEGVWIAEPYINGHYDVENGIRIKDGWLKLPKGPGLGITPDVSVMQEHARYD